MLRVNYWYHNPHFIGEKIESQSDWFSKLVNGRARVRTPNLLYSFYTTYLYHEVTKVYISKRNHYPHFGWCHGLPLLLIHIMTHLLPLFLLIGYKLLCPKFTSHGALRKQCFSNCNVCMNCLQIELKRRFWFSRSGVEPESLHFWQTPWWWWCFRSLDHTLGSQCVDDCYVHR